MVLNRKDGSIDHKSFKDLVDYLDQQQTEPMYVVPFGLVAAYGLVRLSIVIFAEINLLKFIIPINLLHKWY